jgi:hypothetical protein
MRWRALLVVSLVVNVALGVAWFASSHRQAARLAAALQTNSTPVVKTNVVIRRQFFSWAEVESSDYPTYVANLREIGCPEQTIRDIIIADVNTLYARRMATEIVTPEQQWWRSEPDPAVVQAAADKARELDDERRALLASLLGVDWESRDLANLPRPSHPAIPLDGPVLGTLSEETKQAVQNISAWAQERLENYLDAQRQRGRNPDPVELAKLRAQTRDELTRLLSPLQLEEYLLRYSQNARDLRAEIGQLKYLETTPEEFRALFRATDLIDQKLQLLAGSNDPNSVAQRKALEQQRDNAIRIALGATRYDQYVQLHDPIYRDSYAAAQEAGDPDAAQALYQINLAAAQQEEAIRTNSNLTPQQQAVARQKVILDQLKARMLVLGQELPPEASLDQYSQTLLMQQQQQQQQPTPPGPEQPAGRTRPYVLGIGETVASVARLYGLSIADMEAANPGVNLNRVRSGDSILVPDASRGP